MSAVPRSHAEVKSSPAADPQAPSGHAAAPSQRVVILGASNVMRNISTVVATTEHFRGQPQEIMLAAGHGRSYGQTSRILGRALPAIRTCAIWETLSERQQLRTVSLVTDIGNDLLYGASVEMITAWVRECLENLAPLSDRVILTELPLENIARLNFSTFFFIRSILFPKSRLTLEGARAMSVELNEEVRQLAVNFGATLIKPDAGWYGVDPIHIQRRHRDVAWRQILGAWKTDEPLPAALPPRAERISLRKCRPHRRWLIGIEQHCAQPALRLTSGTHVSFF